MKSSSCRFESVGFILQTLMSHKTSDSKSTEAQTELSLVKPSDCTKFNGKLCCRDEMSFHYYYDTEVVLYLDGRVQRGLVEFLELGSDVQQIDLGPTHHDSVQSGLVGPATLTMI